MKHSEYQYKELGVCRKYVLDCNFAIMGSLDLTIHTGSLILEVPEEGVSEQRQVIAKT